MISVWWLCVIVPVSSCMGFGLCAALVVAKETDLQMEFRKRVERGHKW